MTSLIEITLKKPIKSFNEPVNVLRRDLDTQPLTAGDLEVVDEADGAMGKMIHFIARVFNLTPAEVRTLSVHDFKAASQAVQPFLSE